METWRPDQEHPAVAMCAACGHPRGAHDTDPSPDEPVCAGLPDRPTVAHSSFDWDVTRETKAEAKARLLAEAEQQLRAALFGGEPVCQCRGFEEERGAD
jgi:hypothetical protein